MKEAGRLGLPGSESYFYVLLIFDMTQIIVLTFEEFYYNMMVIIWSTFFLTSQMLHTLTFLGYLRNIPIYRIIKLMHLTEKNAVSMERSENPYVVVFKERPAK